MLSKQEFYALNHRYNAAQGRAALTSDVYLNRILEDSEVWDALVKKGMITENGTLCEKGKAALEPYRVDNAVILAAGSATRFVPLSLEQHKGLYEVKGEKLIERQIKQLMEAGIKDITVVLGYKKEQLSYLADKFGVRLIFNPLYNMRNNIESLCTAAEELKNTYICVCDSYFTENPFNAYEYQAFNAGYSTSEKADEMYVHIDKDNRIVRMVPEQDGGLVLLGHAYWTAEFSRRFLALAEQDRTAGKYHRAFWEWMVKDTLEELPPFYFKEYRPDAIHEFDRFEQLRAFDNNYIGHTHSDIIRNIKLRFRCDEEDIADFRKVNEGLTNTSFIFRINGTDYIYRHPGEGTEYIINRRNEKRSLILAKEYGIDPTYIYMDVNEGWKISEFIADFREPDYSSPDDTGKVMESLRRLHSLPVTVDYGMRPWEDALKMEELLKEKDPDCFRKYEELKESVGRLYRRTLDDGIQKCFCHGDTYRPNWMIRSDGSTVLIDWEYSGYADPGIDVGYYIVDAMYGYDEAKAAIHSYLQGSWSAEREFHFMAYTAIIAYYWFVWAKYRTSCGADMSSVLENWLYMAEKYADEEAWNGQ